MSLQIQLYFTARFIKASESNCWLFILVDVDMSSCGYLM